MRAILLAVLLLAGCGPNAETAKINEARAAVAYQLADAESAKYRNERIIQVGGTTLVCGEVNAKNGFGAYIGFQPYAYSPKAKALAVYPARVTNEDEAKAAYRFPQDCLPKRASDSSEPLAVENPLEPNASEYDAAAMNDVD